MKPEILKRTGDRNYMKSARVMLASNLFEGQFAEVKKQIVTKIKEKDLNLLIRNDDLLLTMAALELEQKDKFRHHDIIYTLRTLEKVLLKFSDLQNDGNLRSVDLVQPGNYDALVRTMKNLCGYVNSRNIKNTSLVLKIGFSIRSLIIVKRVMCLKTSDYDGLEKMTNAMLLYKEDYSNYAANARAVSEKQKGNAPEELPVENDVKKLRQYCIEEIQKISSKGNLDAEQYSLLQKLVYVRLLTFNARRGDEPAKLTLDDWKKAVGDVWKRKDDIQRLTDPLEIKLANRLKLCYVEGKRKTKGM